MLSVLNVLKSSRTSTSVCVVFHSGHSQAILVLVEVFAVDRISHQEYEHISYFHGSTVCNKYHVGPRAQPDILIKDFKCNQVNPLS